MTFHHRPMLPADVPACVDLIASEPAACRRYGTAIDDLLPAWLRLLDCQAKSAVVFEQVAGSCVTICGIGVSVFVADDFLRALKAQPYWFAAELARRLRQGPSPLLSDRQLAEDNACGGLNALVWEGFIRPGFEQHTELYRRVANVYIEEHRGFLWKEMICHQIDTVDDFHTCIQIGGHLWDAVGGRYTEDLEKDPQEIIKTPHIVGMTRETEIHRPGSWLGVLFEYHPPQFGFNRSEQRLLLSALHGGTDQELSEALGISLATVKKMWRQIYDRVASCLPELVPLNAAGENGTSERGREKKQHLIAYLREHPEELRPVSRKLLRQTTPPAL